MDPAVITDSTGRLVRGLQQIGTQAAGGFHDRKKVHTVGAGSQDAAKAACSESQVPVKAFPHGRFIHIAEQ